MSSQTPTNKHIQIQATLEKGVSPHDDDLGDYQVKYEQEKERAKELEQRLFRALKELTALHSNDEYRHDDHYFSGELQQLRYLVRDWAHRNFSTQRQGNWLTRFKAGFAEAADGDFRAITPHFELYLNSDTLRPKLVRAYVWKELVELVFGKRYGPLRGNLGTL